MAAILKRFFSCESMIRPEQRVGTLPDSRAVYRKAIDMAWPSTVESVLVGLVGMVDTMMVGSIGPDAIAAVGITTQPKFLFLALILSLNVGVTAIIARRKGENDRDAANSVLRQSVILCVIIAVISSLLGTIFARPIIRFAGAGDDILDQAVAYFQIIMGGMFFNCLLLTMNAAQRGAGNTRISMKTNLTANGVNIVLNYLLIGGNLGFPRLGVRGAAIATVVGFAVGFAMSLCSLLHHHQFLSFLHKGSWRFRKETLHGIWSVSASSLVEQLCMRFGFFSYAKIVASLGTIAFATHQICMNILSISFCFGDGLSIAASSLVGQQLGAKRPDMAIVYGKVSQRMAVVVSTVLMVLFFVLREPLMMAFTDDVSIIEAGKDILLIISLATYLQTSQVVLMACLRGAGDTFYTAIISLLSVALVRPGSAWLFCYPLNMGLIGAWVSLVVDQLMRLVGALVRYSGGKWTEHKL